MASIIGRHGSSVATKSDSGRPRIFDARRAPPTIDLEATEVSAETQNEAPAVGAEPEPEPSAPRTSTGAFSDAIIAAVSGASAAALVLGAQLIFGALFGLMGLLLADPIVAAVKVALEDLAKRGKGKT